MLYNRSWFFSFNRGYFRNNSKQTSPTEILNKCLRVCFEFSIKTATDYGRVRVYTRQLLFSESLARLKSEQPPISSTAPTPSTFSLDSSKRSRERSNRAFLTYSSSRKSGSCCRCRYPPRPRPSSC